MDRLVKKPNASGNGVKFWITVTLVLAVAGTGGALALAGLHLNLFDDGGFAQFKWEDHLPLVVNAAVLGFVLLTFLVASICLLRRIGSLGQDRAELSRLALIADKADQAVFVTDADGVIEWVNDGFTRVTGFARGDAVGKQPGGLLLGNLQNLNTTQKLRDGFAGERMFGAEMLCSNRLGHRYWMSISVTPVMDERGRAVSFVGFGMDITSRKRAEDEVARIGKRSELFLNAAGDGILGIDIQGAITFANHAAGRLTDWPEGELIGKPVSTILHQLRVPRSVSGQDELFTGAAFIDGTVQIGDVDEFKARDGSAFPVEYTSTPVHEGSNLLGSVVVFRDVTDRRESESLRTRQARQSALRADAAFGLTNGDTLRDFLKYAMQCLVKHLDGAFARVWTLGADEDTLELQASAGIYTHINGPHGKIPVGMMKVGKIARERLPAVSHNLVTDPDIIDKEWVLRERMTAFIGFPLFVEGRLVGVMGLYSRNKLPTDAMELMGSVSDTIAQGIVRKRNEETLADQAALLDKSRDAIVVMDLRQRCTYWNESARRLFGWGDANVYGQDAEQLLSMDRACFQQARAVVLQKGEWNDGACAVRRGQETLTLEARWTLVSEEDGKPRAILMINTDVTDRKRIEEQFLRTQRMESIGTLAGGIAHDLNNVLSPILMSVEVLRGKISDDAGRRMLAVMEGSAKRGAEMVKQVLTFARGVQGDRVLLQSQHLLRDVVKIIGETLPKTIQLRTEIADGLWPVTGDATQLHQVLVNLAVNARDAMPNGGTLTVQAENHVLESEVEQLGSLILPGFFVVWSVSDTGTGIPPEVAGKIFEPFFTTKEPGQGTGLGLSTALGIVKSHGGFLRVETAVGRGTKFFIYLPAQEGMQTVPAEAEPLDLPSGKGELILAVDDEAAVLTMTKETLEAFGYRVITARDGAEAVAAYTSHRDEIRGVLTDMLMPHMDGPATIRVLKQIDPSVRIIAASGLMDGDRVKDATGLEKVAFLMKPFTAEKLLTTVQRVLAEAA